MRFVLMFIALLIPFSAHAEELHSVVTEWNMVGSNATLGIHSVNDPMVDGVVCHYTLPDAGGLGNDIASTVGMQTEVSNISIACRQVGPISFAESDLQQGSLVFTEDRGGILFSAKEMRIVRVCDPQSNVLVYMVYSTKLIDGSPKNSVSTVPIMPWGDNPVVQCNDWIDVNDHAD